MSKKENYCSPGTVKEYEKDFLFVPKITTTPCCAYCSEEHAKAKGEKRGFFFVCAHCGSFNVVTYAKRNGRLYETICPAGHSFTSS